MPLSNIPRHSLVTLLIIVKIVVTTVQIFIWGELRNGAINLRPLSRPLRLLTLCGLLFTCIFLISILFKDTVRVNSPLELLPTDSTTSRGVLVPSYIIPLTLIAITIGWGYMLTGALHVQPALRWLIFALYGFFTVAPLMFYVLSEAGIGLTRWTAPLLLLLLIYAFIMVPRRSLPVALEWVLLTGLHGLLVSVCLFAAVRTQMVADSEIRSSYIIEATLTGNTLLSAPFLFLAGLSWIDFGIAMSGWFTGAVRERATTVVAIWILFALMGYRLYVPISGIMANGVDVQQLGAWAGAALLCAGLLLIAVWRQRQPPGGNVSRGLITWLIILPISLMILLVIAALFATLFVLPNVFAPGAINRFTQILASIEVLGDGVGQQLPLIVAALALPIIGLAVRRGYATVAAYGLILFWHRVLDWATEPGRQLAWLRFDHADVEMIVLLALTGLALVWLRRHQLTGIRAVQLFGLVLLMALINQIDFLDNPLSPVLGFAGAFFLAFGILWNILTAGGQFANYSSAAFPQTSRLLLYIGYALLSVSIAHWYLVSHNIDQQILQSDFNLSGFHVFGLPLAYLVLVERGEPLLRGADSTQS